MQAATSAEIWTLIAVRLLLILLAVGFASISFVAYRREDTNALKWAAVGFFLLGVGLAVEILYEIGLKGSFFLTQIEIVRLQLIEGVIIAVGFTVLLYSINDY